MKGSAKEMVLKFLEENKGNPISGEETAARLGVSRNTVWKAISSLREEGYVIEGVTKRGYTLVDSNNNLSPQGIGKHLKHPDQYQIIVLPSVDSTNTYAKKLAADGMPEGTVVISEEQTAGKGRLGRKFTSPPKTGLYLTLLLRPEFPAGESLCITTAAAVATAKAVEKVSGKPVQIKWVNDIYQNGKKICGILTEAAINFESQGLEYAALGIGINVMVPPGGFPEEIRHIAGAVFSEECGDETRNVLVAAVLNYFMEIYRQLPEKGYLDEYRKRSLLTGKEVSFTSGSKEYSGIVEGIDDQARLVVRLADGKKECFSAGEVNLKKTFLP